MCSAAPRHASQGHEYPRWSFNDNFEVARSKCRFYLQLFCGQHAAAVRHVRPGAAAGAVLDRANLDAVRLDETAASCFGLDIAP